MEVRFHESVDEFRALAEPLYRRDPVAHTIELTVLRAGALPQDALLLSLSDESDVVGAALQTPPYPLACSAIPVDVIEPAARAVAAVRPALTGVRGTRETAVAFAQVWRDATGRAGTITVEECLYRLACLRPPNGVPGAARVATADDRALLADWTEGFYAETFGHPRDIAAGARFVDAAGDKGDEFVLWTVDATPMSMAMLRAPAAGVSRIGPVFTPPTRRRHGYGSAATAAAAERGASPWRRRCGAVRRPGQPDVERDLPKGRLRSGHRLGPHRFRHPRLTANVRECCPGAACREADTYARRH